MEKCKHDNKHERESRVSQFKIEYQFQVQSHKITETDLISVRKGNHLFLVKNES